MYGLFGSLCQLTRWLDLVIVGSDIVQKFQNGLRSIALLIAAVQNDRMATIIIGDVLTAIDAVYTLIAGQASVLVIEITDKNHITLRQIRIVQPFA